MDQSELNLKSCGEMLKSAREAQGLSIEDISGKLHLSKQLIGEIEADDYQHVVTLAYGKGYVRGYANLLRLPLDEVLGAFDQLEWAGRSGIDPEALAASQPVLSKAKMQTPITADLRNKARKNMGKIFTALIVIIVLILIVMFWQRDHKTTAVNTTGTVTTTTIAPADGKPLVSRDELITKPAKKTYRAKANG